MLTYVHSSIINDNERKWRPICMQQLVFLSLSLTVSLSLCLFLHAAALLNQHWKWKARTFHTTRSCCNQPWGSSLSAAAVGVYCSPNSIPGEVATCSLFLFLVNCAMHLQSGGGREGLLLEWWSGTQVLYNCRYCYKCFPVVSLLNAIAMICGLRYESSRKLSVKCRKMM